MEGVVHSMFGWLLLVFSFIAVLGFKAIREDGRVLITVWLILIIHHAAAVLNAYVLTIPGAEADAMRFHSSAVKWAASGTWRFVLSAQFYIQMLGVIYRMFGSSLFLGEQISVMAFAISCGVLLEIMKILGTRGTRSAVLLLYGLWPTVVLFTSVTLRESLEVLFFMLTVYWGLRVRLGNDRGYVVLVVLSAIAMGVLQKGLLVYALILVPLILLWPLRRGKRSDGSRAVFAGLMSRMVAVLAIFIVGGIIVASDVVPGSGPLKRVMGSEGVTHSVVAFREKAENIDARTTYKVEMGNGSGIDLVSGLIQMSVYYMFAPFPWRMSNALDVYCGLEALWRTILIGFSILAWHKSDGLRRWGISLLLVVYSSLELLWAVGTANYGTAVRHHLTTYWILVVVGGPGVISFCYDHVFRAVRSLRFISSASNERLSHCGCTTKGIEKV